MRLLVVQNVAKLRRLDMASEALEELVWATSLLVDHENLGEAQVLRVAPVAISLTLLNRLPSQLGDNLLPRRVLVVDLA